MINPELPNPTFSPAQGGQMAGDGRAGPPGDRRGPFNNRDAPQGPNHQGPPPQGPQGPPPFHHGPNGPGQGPPPPYGPGGDRFPGPGGPPPGQQFPPQGELFKFTTSSKIKRSTYFSPTSDFFAHGENQKNCEKNSLNCPLKVVSGHYWKLLKIIISIKPYLVTSRGQFNSIKQYEKWLPLK